jgi:sugar O-acyltransferase (sialic acid O-acetyltransferase NeuD family)
MNLLKDHSSMPVIMYGVGSPGVPELAETCARLQLEVAAWIRNVDGPVFLPRGVVATAVSELDPSLRKHPFVLPQFTPGHRYAARADAQLHGFATPATLIDPTAVIASSAEIAPGSYVNSMANIGAGCRIGGFAYINRGASIGHDVELAEFVSIGPAAVLTGGARINRGAFIGAGAIILPRVEIGANAVVGAGANVTRAVPPHSIVVGNPARVIRREIPGYNGYGV